MLLVIEAGNSHITLGGYEGETLVFVSDMLSDARKTRDQYIVAMKELMLLYGVTPEQVDGAIISSVVPELTGTIRDAVSVLCGIPALIVGPGVKSGLHIQIENPAQLGSDIVACAVAALEHYGAPCIVCSLGTATVMSVIDEKSRCCGAVIAAGVGTTQDGFTKRTALLPHVQIEPPKQVVGKNTVTSIQSGLVYGTAAMIDGLIARIREEADCTFRVVATGKMTDKIIPYCKEEIEICDYLLLEGLRLIYQRNQEK
ncbi:MAG: type III pantothenate kinase [Ruminococcaceae bacterium]|nr:type III pantothenate kinase [Oscillospiraceae bacterium]